MRITCTECEQEMNQDGILQHSDSCTSHNFLPRVGQAVHPPTQTIVFDSKEEQDEWYAKLKTTGGSPITKRN